MFLCFFLSRRQKETINDYYINVSSTLYVLIVYNTRFVSLSLTLTLHAQQPTVGTINVLHMRVVF